MDGNHRTPHVVDFSAGRARVLVPFPAVSGSGEHVGGTWGTDPVKPSESRSIATAEAWLVKRKWKAWC